MPIDDQYLCQLFLYKLIHCELLHQFSISCIIIIMHIVFSKFRWSFFFFCYVIMFSEVLTRVNWETFDRKSSVYLAKFLLSGKNKIISLLSWNIFHKMKEIKATDSVFHTVGSAMFGAIFNLVTRVRQP